MLENSTTVNTHKIRFIRSCKINDILVTISSIFWLFQQLQWGSRIQPLQCSCQYLNKSNSTVNVFKISCLLTNRPAPLLSNATALWNIERNTDRNSFQLRPVSFDNVLAAPVTYFVPTEKPAVTHIYQLQFFPLRFRYVPGTFLRYLVSNYLNLAVLREIVLIFLQSALLRILQDKQSTLL